MTENAAKTNSPFPQAWSAKLPTIWIANIQNAARLKTQQQSFNLALRGLMVDNIIIQAKERFNILQVANC
jgi:hypothetical protein